MKSLLHLSLVLGFGLAVVSGCLASPPASPNSPAADAAPDDEPSSLQFTVPVQVNAEFQEGFEPSLRIAPDGTVYVAAARGFLAGSDDSLASPVWRSTDNGMTWTPLSSLLGVREALKSIEGDLAIDATGTVYFVDTYSTDNVLTTWGPDGSWRSTQPIQGTLAADDRPWLAAQGDGLLYYIGNGIVPLPAPEGPAAGARYWFYRSTDGGLTWSLGRGFPESGYCHLAAQPGDGQEVLVACIGPGIGLATGGPRVEAYRSNDRGATWTSALVADDPDDPAGDFPWTAMAADGGAAIAWTTDAATVGVTLWNGTGWNRLPDIPAPGASPSVALAPLGRVGVAAYVDREAGWTMEAWVWNGTGWQHGMADAGPLGAGAEPPQDFFQAAFDPAGRLHIAYQNDVKGTDNPVPIQPYLQPILHVRMA